MAGSCASGLGLQGPFALTAHASSPSTTSSIIKSAGRSFASAPVGLSGLGVSVLADGMIVFVRNGGEGDAAEFPYEPYWLGVVAHDTEDDALAWKAKAGERVDGGHLCTVRKWLIRFRWLWYEPESAGAALTSPKYGRARAYRTGTLAVAVHRGFPGNPLWLKARSSILGHAS